MLWLGGASSDAVAQTADTPAAALARWEAALGDKPFACLVIYDELDHLFRGGEGPSTPSDYDRAAPVDERVIRDIVAWVSKGSCPG